MQYAEVFSKLTYETAAIIFLKKNGEIRVMMGTRNLKTISLMYGFQGRALGGHDTRCNINNGNIAVFDLIIGEARSFSIDRLISINYIGVLETMEQYNKAVNDFVMFKNSYEASKPKYIDMDTFDDTEKANVTAENGADIAADSNGLNVTASDVNDIFSIGGNQK